MKTETGWIGRRVRRVEDHALLTGAGTFVDDVRLPRPLAAAFVRSTVGGASIKEIRVDEARALPGVVHVLTADDLDVNDIRAALDRPEFLPTTEPILAKEVTRYAGEPIALVVAEDAYIAEDAVDCVEVRYGEGAPVMSLEVALAPGAPAVHRSGVGNIMLEAPVISAGEEFDAVLDRAHCVIEERFKTARVTAMAIEACATAAWWDAREERLNVWTSTQVPHLVRTVIARCLGCDEARIHVIAPDVGGGFGQKCVVAREEVAVAAAAWRLRLALRWTEDRRENLSSAFSGHEQELRVRAGFDEQGLLLALDLVARADAGAYSSFPFTGAVEAMMCATEFPNAYKVPKFRSRALAVLTNKPPVAPYRGVARPQACFALERTLDSAARRLGLDRFEIRRRNLIKRDEFPYEGVNGVTYDEGSYLEALEMGLAAVDYERWTERQRAARDEGRLLGLGFSCFNERTGYGTPTFAVRRMPVTPGYDTAELRMDPSGAVVVAVGASAHGQGHRTSLAQIVADRLGIDLLRVRVIQGDTDLCPYGFGTFASRGAVVSGSAVARAADLAAAKIRRIAAHLLEASECDIRLGAGRAEVAGDPHSYVEIDEIARIAHHQRQSLPSDEEAKLDFRGEYDPPGTFSNAAHVAIVEVDPGCGRVSFLDYVVTEDCGVIINPMIVEGQVAGGVAQGIAAALYEEFGLRLRGGTLRHVDVDGLPRANGGRGP